MIDRVQEMLQPTSSLTAGLFAPNSRYHGAQTTTLASPAGGGDDGAAGETIVYLCRRFVPPPGRFATRAEHVVAQGERLDGIAFVHLGDPELYWQLCDANGAMRPAELTARMGRRLRICFPEGVPGTPGLSAL